MGRRPRPLSPSLLAMSTRLGELAAASGGIVTAAQCRALGVDDVAVRRLIAAGGWTRPRKPRPRRPRGAGRAKLASSAAQRA
jgi:hypothetical protein